MRPRAVLFLILAALAFGAASLSPAPVGADAPAPRMDVEAENLELDLEARTAVLTGNVRLGRADLAVRAPRVEVRYDEAGAVVWARGTGGITAELKGIEAHAPEVELDLPAQRLELRGGVRLTRGAGWLTADRATVELGSRKVTLRGVKGALPLPR